MGMRRWVIRTLAIGFLASSSWAGAVAPSSSAPETTAPESVPVFWLAAVEEPPSVYPEIIPPREPESTNNGGVGFLLDVNWLNKYVYRGVDQSTIAGKPENAAQFDVSAEFDLGKIPHPYIGLFVNVFNNDPVSRFQEVRPYFGLDWNLKPITIRAGANSYIYPNRKNQDTQEVFLSLALNDGFLLRSVHPVLEPYIYGAYDFSLYNGFYLETGVRHEFVFEDVGCTLTPLARLGYVLDNSYFALHSGSRDYGLQHYDLGLIGTASINHLLRVNRKYGEWSVVGSLYYTGRLDANLRANTQVWGGVGIQFKY